MEIEEDDKTDALTETGYKALVEELDYLKT